MHSVHSLSWGVGAEAGEDAGGGVVALANVRRGRREHAFRGIGLTSGRTPAAAKDACKARIRGSGTYWCVVIVGQAATDSQLLLLQDFREVILLQLMSKLYQSCHDIYLF